MTKVTIIGSIKKLQVPKAIVFEDYIDSNFQTGGFKKFPDHYDTIELIARNYYGTGKDLMFAYHDKDRNAGVLYFGEFNDGFVEDQSI